MDDRDRLKVVLRHLMEHNDGHIEDYQRWIDLAVINNLDDVAALLKEASDSVQKAGKALRRAFELMEHPSQ